MVHGDVDAPIEGESRTGERTGVGGIMVSLGVFAAISLLNFGERETLSDNCVW